MRLRLDSRPRESISQRSNPDPGRFEPRQQSVTLLSLARRLGEGNRQHARHDERGAPSWIAVMGSSRNTNPRSIVATGPTVPSIEAWLEPMSRMPTDMSITRQHGRENRHQEREPVDRRRLRPQERRLADHEEVAHDGRAETIEARLAKRTLPIFFTIRPLPMSRSHRRTRRAQPRRRRAAPFPAACEVVGEHERDAHVGEDQRRHVPPGDRAAVEEAEMRTTKVG